jgi:hypothetical protein
MLKELSTCTEASFRSKGLDTRIERFKIACNFGLAAYENPTVEINCFQAEKVANPINQRTKTRF